MDLTVLFRVGEDKREELLQTFRAVIALPGPGPTLQGVFEDVTERGRFLWIEQWPDPVEFGQRVRSHEVQVAIGAIEVLGTLDTMRAGGVPVDGKTVVEWRPCNAE